MIYSILFLPFTFVRICLFVYPYISTLSQPVPPSLHLFLFLPLLLLHFLFFTLSSILFYSFFFFSLFQAGGGSGLGMMITKGIVDLHQGEIRCSTSEYYSLRSTILFLRLERQVNLS